MSMSVLVRPCPLRPCVAALLLTPLFNPTWAQAVGSANNVAELAPVTVFGESVAPTTTQTTAQTLTQRQIRSMEDLGRRGDPGVDYNRNSESVNIRGLDRDRVLTTVDGIRLPWLNDGARSQTSTGGAQGGLDTVDFRGLSYADVVRGAGSLQGSGALGGALQLFTLNPEDVLADAQNFGALIKTDYDSADHSRGVHSALAGRAGDTTWLIQAGLRRGHELQTRGGDDLGGALRSKANPADTKQHSLLVKLQQRFSGGHKLGLTGETFKRENDVLLKTSGNNYVSDSNRVAEHAKRDRVSLDYAFEHADGSGWIDNAKAMVYWQKLRRNDDQNGVRVATPDGRAFIPDNVFIFGYGLPGNPYAPLAAGYPSGPYGRNNQIEKTAFGVSGSLDKRHAFAGGSNTFRLGFEAYRIDAEQFSAGYDNCPGVDIPAAVVAVFGPATCALLHSNQADMPKAEGVQWAVHAANELGLADGRFKLTPGLRYDHYQQKPKITAAFASNIHPVSGQLLNKNKDGKLSASLLGRVQAADHVTVYAQWAQGFRAPDATELYMNYGAVGNYLSLGNPALKPEESQGIEIGTQLGDRRLGAALNVFDTRYQHFIDVAVPVTDPTTLAELGLAAGDYPLGVTRAENLNRVRIHGVEFSTHWEFAPDWQVWGSLAYTKGKDRQTGRALNSVAPLTGLVGISLAREHVGADLTLRMVKARDRVADDANDFKAPGYGLMDLSGYWQPENLRGVKFQLGVFNVLNKTYWNALNVPSGTLAQPAAYYTERGRSLRASVSWQY